MVSALPATLLAAIERKISDPRDRHDRLAGAPAGVVTDPEELNRMFEGAFPGGSEALRLGLEQMKSWGQQMPPMHVTQYADGSIGASSEDRDFVPLAPPAGAAAIVRLETAIGRPLPDDLRQVYGIADGGWGPGLASGGLYPLERVTQELEDLRRRGPGYTGEMPWPDNLVPIADTTGPVSYDLDSGAIVAFDDYWYDNEIPIEQAFATIHPDLARWLEEWMAGEAGA